MTVPFGGKGNVLGGSTGSSNSNNNKNSRDPYLRTATTAPAYNNNNHNKPDPLAMDKTSSSSAAAAAAAARARASAPPESWVKDDPSPMPPPPASTSTQKVYYEGPSSPAYSPSSTSTTYRDPLFAVAFFVQLAMIWAMAIGWGPAAFPQSEQEARERQYQARRNQSSSATKMATDATGLVLLLTMAFAVAWISTSVGLGILAQYSHRIIPLTFWAPPVAAFLAAAGSTYVLGSLQASLPAYYTAASIAAVTAFTYYFFARRYMTFAASTLHTALQALKAHSGLLKLALGSTLLTYAWLILWTIASLGCFQYYQQHHGANSGKPRTRQVPCEDDPRRLCTVTITDYTPLYMTVFMLLSLFWTSQVIQNILHTTTAGTIADWWIRPENKLRGGDQRGGALRNALWRSCTTSLGSICFGSLIVAIVTTLERIVANIVENNKRKQQQRQQEEERRNMNQRQRDPYGRDQFGSPYITPPPRMNQHRNNGGGGGGGANEILLWILQWLRRLAEYINSWAFVYVGLYGDTYWTAGSKVATQLFAQAGWNTFMSDRLVYRVLTLAKMSIALMSGAATVVAQTALSNAGSLSSGWLGSATKSDTDPTTLRWMVFALGFIMGYWLSSITLFVVESAVRTVMVCFVEQPGAFQSNHPVMHRELEKGWSHAYPEAYAQHQQQHQQHQRKYY